MNTSERQRQVRDFIADHWKRRGFAPTLREIGAAVGVASTTAIRDFLLILRREGVVTWEPGLSRTVRLVEVHGKRSRSR